MTKTDIFEDLRDFTRYAPGIGADTSFDQLATHIRVITSEVWDYITVPVYMALRSETPADATDEQKAALAEGLELLKTAIASGTLMKHQIFATVNKAGTEASLYKYQHEELKAHYRDAYWTAIDELVEWLQKNRTVGGYSDSDLCKELESLPLKSAEEFDRYFQIGRSSYFFSRVRYLIRAKWERIRKNVKEEDPAQMEMARKAVCYLVMADVVMTFDVTEWPRAIRYDFNHEYSKGSSTQSRQNLAKTFLEEAKAAEAAIADLNAGTTGTGLQNFNKESNKHFTML